MLHTPVKDEPTCVCNFLCTPRYKSQIYAKKTKSLSLFKIFIINVLTPIFIVKIVILGFLAD